MNTVVHTDRLAPFTWRPGDLLERLEQVVGAGALLAMVLLPVADLLTRTVTRTGLSGAVEYTQHLSLWVGFAGAVIAARHGGHLSLVVGATNPLRLMLLASVSAVVSLCLAAASWTFLASEADSPNRIGGWLSVTAAAAILPAAFALAGAHFIARAGSGRARMFAVCAAALAMAALQFVDGAALPTPAIGAIVGLLVIGAAFGLPIFVMLGGIALVLLYGDGVPAAAIPVETYRLVVSPTIPAIPLFTLTGFVLARGNSAQRLVRLFDALFGALPGGTAIAATLVCAFFSAFTGASGVTILALGGLLLPALRASGGSESFSLGLITATGSIGLLFPPSLAVILYGVVAQVPIPELFRAGAIPGVLMVAAVSLYAMVQTRRAPSTATPFDVTVACRALWQCRYELLLPVLVFVAIFSGAATLIEAAAISAFYVLVVEVCIHRELKLLKDLPHELVRCATLLGGVFAIIGVAMGVTNFLVDAMIPMKLVAWVSAHVDSRIAFLLMLNAALILVGCVMDIFSAIFVVLPLIIPVSRLFGIDPLHLGMIFLLNLEIGYLTPPVGMNLFLASYRLERPIVDVYRSVLPFLAVLAAVLAIVTFVPSLIIGVHPQ